MIIAFLYTSTNPFIYATKFNPVKKILIKMIPCKKTAVQPTDGSMTTATRTIDKRTGDQRYWREQIDDVKTKEQQKNSHIHL